MKSAFTNGINPTDHHLQSKKIVFWIALFCFTLEAVFVLMDMLLSFTQWVPIIELRKIFDMTREISVGTWFSTILSFVIGITLLLVSFTVRSAKKSGWEVRGWLILSFFFMYMSVDDTACIHERSGDFLDRLMSANAVPAGLSGLVDQFPTYYWLLLLGPWFAVIGLFMLVFLWQRFGRVGLRKYLIFSLTGLAGAMLIDFVEGTGRGVTRISLTSGMSQGAVVHLIRLTEESLEIFSMIVLFCTCLRYLTILLEGRTFAVTGEPVFRPYAGG